MSFDEKKEHSLKKKAHLPTPATSKSMQANKAKDTQPEMVARRMVHGMGYRYRLHRNDLPGKPDLTFPTRKAVIEVRGCFWHQHSACRADITPKTRTKFWVEKFEANVARDARNLEALEKLGWRVLVIWECQVGAPDLRERFRGFLGPA